MLSLLFFATVVHAGEIISVPVENPLPVYFETRRPAARSQIGGRGLRLSAIDRQPGGVLHAYCIDGEDRASKWISVDDGLTWTQSEEEPQAAPGLTRPVDFRSHSKKEPAEFLETGERDAHLVVLSDGRLLCTFARQTVPNGIFAITSDDQGETWDTDSPIYLAASHPKFHGLPVSFELDDGTILTAHSIRAYRESPKNPEKDSVVHLVRWRLPGDALETVAPHEGPLLADPYEWAKYHGAGTGFTGNLQRISYWKKSSTKRVRLPDQYKGAMGRFPNGELVVGAYFEDKPRYSRIYRSADDGATWTRVEYTGTKLLGKEPSILCLRDNKTILFKTQLVQESEPHSPLYRSTDRGESWSQVDYGELSLSYPRNMIQFSDGSITMFNSSGNYREDEGAENTKAWRLRSFDGGLTWPERKEVSGAWTRPRPLFTEAAFLALSDTHILAAARVNGDHVHSVTGEMPPTGLGGHNTEINQKMALVESTDGGLSWSRERFVLDFADVQAKFLLLSDGRILCTYRCRSELPYGVKGVFSHDDGKTWDLEHPVILGVHSDVFGTWQHDIELPTGAMRTAWAWFGDGPFNFEVVHWELSN